VIIFRDIAVSNKYPPWLTLPQNVRILIFTEAGRSIEIRDANRNFEKYKSADIKPCMIYTGGEKCPNFKIFFHDEYYELQGENIATHRAIKINFFNSLDSDFNNTME